jgi:ribosomal protein S18 acetylase RimI-like enzyme
MSPSNMNSDTVKTVSIIEAQTDNVPGMADCHIAAFPERFMTRMGFKWLCGLYRFFINHAGGISYVAVDATGKVVGFAVGGEPDTRKKFLRFAMLRYSHIIFCKFITDSLVRAVLIEELLKKLHLKRATVSNDKGEEQRAGDKCGNLLSICVLPDFRGTGVADKLIEFFQEACAAKGYKQLKLSVVSKNSRAIAFYKKHHWYETGTSSESTKFALDL